MKNNVMLYTAYAEKFRSLSDEQFGKLVRAMIEYQESGEVPEIPDAAVALSFDVVRFDIDRNNVRYEETCAKRREAGSKGGLAKAEKQKLANASKDSKSYQNNHKHIH